MSGLITGIVGVTIGAVSTGLSFGQAAQQRKRQEAADRKAEQMMRSARRKLDVNVYDELAVPKEAFELERENLLTQGATALQAGTEGEARGAAATAGRVQMAQGAAEAKVRAQMAQEIADLNKLSAAETSRLRDIGVQLDLGEIEGAQLASREAAEMRAAAINQGFQSAASTAQQAMSFIPLYQQNRAAQKAAVSQVKLSADETKQFEQYGKVPGMREYALDEQGNILESLELDFGRVGQMSRREFRKFRKSLTPQQRQLLFTNKQYIDAYQNPFNVFSLQDQFQPRN